MALSVSRTRYAVRSIPVMFIQSAYVPYMTSAVIYRAGPNEQGAIRGVLGRGFRVCDYAARAGLRLAQAARAVQSRGRVGAVAPVAGSDRVRAELLRHRPDVAESSRALPPRAHRRPQDGILEPSAAGGDRADPVRNDDPRLVSHVLGVDVSIRRGPFDVRYVLQHHAAASGAHQGVRA